MSEYILKAQAREAVGRAANNKLKTQGKIPGVYYHHGEPSRPLSLLEKDVQALLSTSHAIINLRVGGESYKAVAKEVQYSPVARRPIHISLEGVSNNEVFHTSVHVSVFHSETCPWQKAGGVVQTLNHEVEIECYPKDMPSELKVDVSDLEIGDAILLKHLK